MNKTFDFLVIGSGVAGLNFALKTSKYGTVAVITKKELMESNSNYAQGGIAAVMDKYDSFEKHINDTMEAGCGINDKNAVRIIVEEAPKQIRRLINIGVGFSKKQNDLCLTREGGHSERRIAHAHDTTGKEIERALIHQIRHNKNIITFESHTAFELLIEKGECRGALVYDNENKKIKTFLSKATIIATGGACHVYKRNSNPKIATGDGIAMAFKAGAEIRDMEFIQFHPTALAKKDKPSLLISETLRGEGGILKNSTGEAFMRKYHKLKDLAPRDIVSRAILKEMKSGPVYLDIRHKGTEFIKNRFPYLYEQLWWYGIKMDKNLIPVAPAAHFVCGGIHTDLNGQTNIKGLFAFGEAAHTGVHGANRLASNSLLECMVFSGRAARAAKKYAQRRKLMDIKPRLLEFKTNNLPIASFKKINEIKKTIQELMWSSVGIVREKEKMIKAIKKLEGMGEKIDLACGKNINKKIIEVKSMHSVAMLIAKAALKRKKSIGTHFVLNGAPRASQRYQ